MAEDIIRELFAGIMLIIGAFMGIIKWLFDRVVKEFKPNGGSSLKDQINRLESRIDDLFHILGQGDNKNED